MKYQRPGYTESTLLFIEYLIEHKKNIINHTKNEFINWLFTTSGFYDKKFSGSYFDFDAEKISESENFNKFINDYRSSLIDSDKLHLLLHKVCNNQSLIEGFTSYLRPKDHLFWYNYKSWYKILENKNVLLVNSFAPIMEKQYVCGNIKKIDPEFPKLSNITSYKTPYTFFNNGPDNNFFETLEKMKQHILKINFDIAIISCGAYACLLVDYCHKLGKSGISIGSRMHNMWGIDLNIKNNPLWVSEIPKEYIPVGYEKIEKGSYWKR